MPSPDPRFPDVSEVRSRTMSRIRSKDTGPEIALRRALHAAGLRFRLGQAVQLPHRKVKPDLVFKGAKVAVFVDGCFWHGCPVHGTRPATNTSYWSPKLDRNVTRDRETDAALEALGWQVVRVWEHETVDAASRAVRTALGK